MKEKISFISYMRVKIRKMLRKMKKHKKNWKSISKK